MPSFATGRSRTAAVALASHQYLVPTSSVADGLGGFAPGFNSAYSNAFGLSLQVSHSVFDKGFEQDPDYVGPGFRIRWSITVEFEIAVGGVTGAGTTILEGALSDWEVVGSLPGGEGVATYVSGDMSGSLTASWQLVEYLDQDLIASTPYTETAVPGDATLSAHGSFTFSYQGYTLTPSFTYTEVFAAAASGGVANGAGLNFVCVTGDSLSISASCDGISFTASDFDLEASDATFAGTPLSGTLTRTTAATYATASIQATPDWAHDYAVTNFDYETGDPVEVTTRHECGGVLISTSTGGHRYPASGLTSNYTASLAANSETDSATRAESLGVCGGASSVNYIRVDETWADAYGTYPNSSNFLGPSPGLNPGVNAQYGIFQSQDYDAGTFQVDSEHLFQLFETSSHFTASSGGVLSMSGGVLTFTNPNLFQDNFYAYHPTENPTGYVLKPFGYRYYRFQMRATVANARFRLTIFGTLSKGPTVTLLGDWDFTVSQANTWETFELDLCHPHFFHAGSSTVVKRLEPAQFQAFPAETGVIATIYDQATYQVRSFTGYYKTDGNRTPALLLGPCSCGETSMAQMNKAPAVFDSCSSATETSTQVAGGVLYARLIANGACVFNLLAGSGKLGAAFDAWIATYDDALNDTGIHFTKGVSPYLDATPAHSGFVIRRPLWSELTLDTPFTIQAVKRGLRHGYYGCGNIRTGAYSPTLTFQGDKVWNGELACNIHDDRTPLPRVRLELLDDNTSAVVASATTNDDGFARLFAKYGAQQPFSSFPRSAACATRQQYTGTAAASTVAYTAQGLLLNGYWLRCSQFKDGDSDQRATFFWDPDRLHILDRYPHWRAFNCDQDLGGVDLAQAAATLLFRVYRVGGAVYAERSVDAGVTWSGEQTLLTDAEGNAPGAPGSAPTLNVDQHDRLWCWAHDTDGAARLFRSEDYGGSWTEVATHAGLRFPRAARQVNRAVVVGHDGDELRAYSSDDDGVTLTALSGLTLTAPRQLAALRIDRRDRLHLVYTDGTNLLHRLLQDDGTWSSAATLTTGAALAGYAVGLERGALLHWNSGLQARQTDETYGADAGVLVDPAGIDYDDALGALWSHGEALYVCGFAESTGALETRVSLDRGASWVEPT